MALIEAQYIKDNFEPWEKFCTVSGSSFTPDEILTKKITLAEDEFLQYVSVTEATMTTILRRHLFNTVRKNVFDIRHGDTKFENRPQVLLDYDATIEWLERYRAGDAGIQDENSIRITAKTRRYGSWFNEESSEVSTPE